MGLWEGYGVSDDSDGQCVGHQAALVPLTLNIQNSG